MLTPPHQRPPAFWIYPVATVAYLMAFALSFWTANHGDSIAPIWLATGVAVWLLLRFGPRMLVVFFLGELIPKLLHQGTTDSLVVLVAKWIMSAGNLLTVFLGAWLWRLVHARWADRLGEFTEAIACLATGCLAPLAAASIGVAAFVLSGQQHPSGPVHLWLAWWTGDAIGVLFILPLLLSLPEFGRRLRRLGSGEQLRCAALVGLTAVLCWIAFWRPEGSSYLFALFPLLMLAALWGGVSGSRLVAGLILAMGTLAAACGRGPLVTGDLRADLITVQLFLSAIAVLALLLPPLHARLNLFRPLSLGLLFGGWALSGLMFYILQQQAERETRADFVQLTDSAQRDIQRHLQACTDLLHSGTGFLLAAPDARHAGWADFARTFDLKHRYPGMLSLGVVYPVPAAAAADFEQRIRADAAPGFSIRPVPGGTTGPVAVHYVLTYLEPLPGNETAIGIDLATEKIRRDAAEAARDTGLPQLSGRISLVQDASHKPGFLLFMPVYRQGAPVRTVEQRRDALVAWVDTPLLAEEFLLGALGERAAQLHVNLFEGPRPDAAHLIFSNRADQTDLPRFARTTTFELAGQQFSLGWNLATGESKRHYSPLIWMALTFAVVTVLLTGLVLSLQVFRERAEALAADRTRALEESEQRFRTLIESSPEPVAVHRDGKWVYGNPAALRLIGASSLTQMVGRPIAEVVHPDFKALAAARLAQVNFQGINAPLTPMRLIRVGGGEIEVESQATAILFNGQPAVHVLVRDVTARNLAQREHQLALERLQRIASRVPGVVYEYRVRPDGRASFPFASEAMRDIYGVSPEEVREDATAVFKVIHPDDFERVALSIRESALSLAPWTCEYRAVLPDGRVRWLLGNSIPQREADGGTLWHGFITDITDRKQAEAELRDSKLQLSAILDNVAAYIYLKDPAGRYTFANRMVCQLFQLPLEKVVGKTDDRFFDPATAERIRRNDRQVFEDGRTIQVEETNRSLRDKRTLTYLSVKLPLHTPSGEIYALCGISTEITALKEAEAEQHRLEEQNQQLQKSESLGRMAAAIAHHFNNQLHAVMMNLDMASADLPGFSAPAARLAEAMKCARKATEVSTQMLTYLGQSQGKRTPHDLAEICRTNLPLLHAVAPKQVALEVHLPSPGPVINANANQLQQLLTNLLTNAWEACGDQPGRIRLTVRTASVMEIPANHVPPDWRAQDTAYACLEVTDNGSGISAEEVDKIFDPFYTSKFVGRGLGLPVVLGIVRAHQGTIALRSEPGTGSTFLLFFPLALTVAPPPPLRSMAPFPPKTGAGRTVLVAEDDPVVLKVTVHALEYFGFVVLAARDGIEALDLFRAHRQEIGCVVCDLSMPRLGGWEVLAELRRLAPNLPVILSSGHDEQNVMEGHHEAKPQAFLSKPYDTSALIGAITQVLAAGFR